MQPISIINSTKSEEIFSSDGKISLSFDIVNKRANRFNSCCLKVILEDQVVRYDLPSLSNEAENIVVKFNKMNLEDEFNTTCQIFQGDRIICSKKHNFLIKRGMR